MVEKLILDIRTAETFRPILTEIDELLNSRNIEKILATALDHGGDFAEIYLEYGTGSGLSLEEDKIRHAQSGISRGIGVRVISEDKVGYAYSELFELDSVLKAAKTASMIADRRSHRAISVDTEPTPMKPANYSPIRVTPELVSIKEKADLLWRAMKAGYEADNRVFQVETSIWDTVKFIFVVNSDGLVTGDQRVLVKFNVLTLAGKDSNKQIGYHGGGGRIGYEYFETMTPEYFAREAARQAINLLDAREAPAGPQTVVLGNGWAGVLLHEAVGHGLEADFNRKGTSLYSGRIGQKVASELCTVIDDGTAPHKRGTINIDDEGQPSERKILIEKGILKGYMTDILNARLTGARSTGSGRRESYKHYPIPRMTNTFLMQGESEPRDIISSVKNGLYAKSFGGGQVDITNGQFVFQVTEGYMIEDGHITYPVRGANLIGSGPEILQKVVMVGNDLQLDAGLGTCGKDGQSVPVGVGTPTCKISEITVGGTNIKDRR